MSIDPRSIPRSPALPLQEDYPRANEYLFAVYVYRIISDNACSTFRRPSSNRSIDRGPPVRCNSTDTVVINANSYHKFPQKMCKNIPDRLSPGSPHHYY